MILTEIKNAIANAIRKKFGQIDVPELSVETPENPEHGDYATNVAMILAKVLKKSPMEIAAILESGIRNQGLWETKVAPPGFINFFLSLAALQREFEEILKNKQKYGRPPVSKSDFNKVNLEFISANPTGPLTIGNGRGAFLGDALSKILKFCGHKVTREYYINDARASNQIQELGKAVLGRSESYPGPYTDEIRKRLKKRLYNLSKMNEEDVGFSAAQEIQKDNKKFIKKVLKIKFDVWYSEEKLYKNKLVRKATDELNKRGAMYEKDGALWFRASGYGDSEDRVAVRTGGAPTYFLPDVAYHKGKLVGRGFDLAIDILGADHHGTFPRVLAGLRALRVEPNRVRAIFTQIVRLIRKGEEVKMSKRRGLYVTLAELIDEVGLDAARFFFLEKSPDTHMDFDLDLAKEKSVKNPVYYVQYAHARISSIFRKSRNTKYEIRNTRYDLLKTHDELGLIKKLIQFPEVVEDTAKDYQIHRLARYAHELARSFHNFYEKHRVITEDKELTRARLQLVKVTQIVLQITLDLLGISAPRRM